MSEEILSAQPDEPSKAEAAGIEADAGLAPAVDSAAVKVETTAEGPAEAQAGAALEPQAGEDGQAAAKAVEHLAAAAKIEGDISMRRSPWRSSAAAIAYVQRAAKADHVQIRTSDRLTIIALLFFCIAEVLSLVYSPLREFRFAFMCCCDVILGACIVLFLVYRIGILSALNTRQALICWQMGLGCIFLGIFICLNSIFAIAYLVETFFPHSML